MQNLNYKWNFFQLIIASFTAIVHQLIYNSIIIQFLCLFDVFIVLFFFFN